MYYLEKFKFVWNECVQGSVLSEKYPTGMSVLDSRLNDEQPIIDSAKSGDRDAFEQIVGSYQDRVVRYAQNIVGDSHAAEDVAQRTFVNVFDHLQSYDPTKGRFSTWVYRIARNVALNHLRSVRGKEICYGTMTPSLLNREDPSAAAELKEQFESLDRALAKLPENQRSVWVLSELEKLTQSEIAKIEGIPEGTVKSRVSRARQAIRKAFSGRIGMER